MRAEAKASARTFNFASRWPRSSGSGPQNRERKCKSHAGSHPSLKLWMAGILKCGIRSAESILRAHGHLKTFGAGQGALSAVSSQKDFTLQFERQRHVQQVESAAAKSFGVFG